MKILNDLWLRLRTKALDVINDEKGEVNIVAIVVLIGVAVLLAIVFKDQIIELLNKLFETITKTATDVVTP